MSIAHKLRIGTAAMAALLVLPFAPTANAEVHASRHDTRGVQLAHMGGNVDRDTSSYPCMNEEGLQRGGMMPGRSMSDGMSMHGQRSRGMMMGQGMMGPGMMGRGMMDRDDQSGGMRVVPYAHLSVDDVRHFLQHQLEAGGNPRLKVGEVKERDDSTIVADIVAQEGALVDRFDVDQHSGEMKRVQ